MLSGPSEAPGLWLAGLNDVGGRTREDYENIARRYLRPLVGARRLDQITTPMIREMLAMLARPDAEGGRASSPARCNTSMRSCGSR